MPRDWRSVFTDIYFSLDLLSPTIWLLLKVYKMNEMERKIQKELKQMLKADWTEKKCILGSIGA